MNLQGKTRETKNNGKGKSTNIFDQNLSKVEPSKADQRKDFGKVLKLFVDQGKIKPSEKLQEK
jgi:hypothetical protein